MRFRDRTHAGGRLAQELLLPAGEIRSPRITIPDPVPVDPPVPPVPPLPEPPVPDRPLPEPPPLPDPDQPFPEPIPVPDPLAETDGPALRW